eukprot:g128.t1
MSHTHTCIASTEYRLISKKGEGTFSEVLKAQCIKTGQYTAIKCMKNHFDSIEQVNNLREIQALQRLSPNKHIVKLFEVLYDEPTGRLALVFELMSMNIYELIRGRRHYFPESTLKNYMYQLTQAMDHMHRSGIFHRDIKPENILIRGDDLKVADFGSCRGIYSKQPYTEYISTRWYRAPECLLTDGYYGYKMDMWGVGCVTFEVIALYPLFPGTNELDQIKKIHKVVGTPSEEILEKFKSHGASHIDFNFPYYRGQSISKMIPHVSPESIDFIEKLVRYEPEHRLSARQALRHPWFIELRSGSSKKDARAHNKSGNKSSKRYLRHRTRSGDIRSEAKRDMQTKHSTKESDGSDTDGAVDANLSRWKHQQRKKSGRKFAAQESSDTSDNEGIVNGITSASNNTVKVMGMGMMQSYRGGAGSGVSSMSHKPMKSLPRIKGQKHYNASKFDSAMSDSISSNLPSIGASSSNSSSLHKHHNHHHNYHNSYNYQGGSTVSSSNSSNLGGFQMLKIDSRSDKGASQTHNSSRNYPSGNIHHQSSSSMSTAAASSYGQSAANTRSSAHQYLNNHLKPRRTQKYHQPRRNRDRNAKRSGTHVGKSTYGAAAKSLLIQAANRNALQLKASAMIKPRVTGHSAMTRKLTKKYQSPYSQAYIRRTRDHRK